MGPKHARASAGQGQTPTGPRPTRFVDFTLRAWREDRDWLHILPHATPVGDLRHPVAVRSRRFDRRAYVVDGQASLDAAARIGHDLSRLLLPAPVFRLLGESIRWAAEQPGTGLRLRLCLDDDLIDLPWEFLYRPDLPRTVARSGFLLCDARLSLVREPPTQSAVAAPSSDPQRLLFIGTFYPGDRDLWTVRDEYQRLVEATRPVASWLSSEFVKASAPEAFAGALDEETEIIHYSGHTDREGARGYLLREVSARRRDRFFSDDLAPRLVRAGTRLAVFSACNSGAWPFVQPLLQAGVPAVIGAHGIVTNVGSIEFFGTLYAGLAVGLSLDEALTHARLHLFGRSTAAYPTEWGRFMVYLPAAEAVLFPRPTTPSVRREQAAVRTARRDAVRKAYELLAEPGGAGVGKVMSELAGRAVLILGRFTAERKPVLEAIRGTLAAHPRGYQPILFDFERPKGFTLGESIVGLAALSRFVIADLTDAKSLPAELQIIVPQFPTRPVVPILREGKREYALFDHLRGFRNVIQPTVRYRDQSSLLRDLETAVIGAAEARLGQLKAGGEAGAS
jgi:hypothetical protein